MNKAQGLTLIELLCVLAITALTLTLSSGLFDVLSRNQVTSTANQLLGATQFTRTKAIQEGASTFFCLSTEDNQCSSQWSQRGLVYRNSDNDKKYGDDDDELIRVIDFGSSTKIQWKAFQNKSYLEMTPSGMTHYQNGTYTICHSNKDTRIAKALIMNVAGRPYFSIDKDDDGIANYSNGDNLSCI